MIKKNKVNLLFWFLLKKKKKKENDGLNILWYYYLYLGLYTIIVNCYNYSYVPIWLFVAVYYVCITCQLFAV